MSRYSSIFKTPENEAKYMAAYDAVLALWPVPYESFDPHSVPFHFLITNYSPIYSKSFHQIPPSSKFSSDFYPVL